MSKGAVHPVSNSGEATPEVDPSVLAKFSIDGATLENLLTTSALSELDAVNGTKGVLDGLAIDPEVGVLGDEDVYQRKIVFGPNEFPEPPHASLLMLFLEALKDPTLIILSVAASVSLGLGLAFHPEDGWIEGMAILVAVLIVSMVTAVNDFQKEKQFRALNDVKNDRVIKVIRQGEQTTTSIMDIVVGDIVILENGDWVPADGLFLADYGFNCECDESGLTGESISVPKNEDRPFMLSGTKVTDGVGRMVVTGVGVQTEWGRTLASLNQEQDPTPLQDKLEVLANNIGKIGVVVAVATMLVQIISWLIIYSVNNTPFTTADSLERVVDSFIIAVTIVVVAVPEGLPLAVTISLAYSMKKMMADNNLVRKLEACETMGGATNICSDKTGTLTENIMTVTRGWIADTFYDDLTTHQSIHERVMYLYTTGIAVNSKAFFEVREEGGRPDVSGNKTEGALLLNIQQVFGHDYKSLRKSNVVHKLYTFDAQRKAMSTMVVVDNEPAQFRLYVKGAAERVLANCSNYLSPTGEVLALPEAKHSELTTIIDQMASSGLRCLSLAYRDFAEDQGDAWDRAPEEELTLIGIVGIVDPVRAAVPQAVADCQSAGIIVRMVTGDNLLTATHIARECGILTDDGITIQGPDFRKMTTEQMDAILPRLQVMARSAPTDKFILVHRLRELGEVVAVTGDGTNDAPALKEADVGLSMGIAGTEVAKEASDIVILDDNFSSIVKSVMWGRSVYDNIKKFLQFQLTINLVSLMVAFVGALAQFGTPLKAIQLLWVNLIMDTLAALALGTEMPTPALLQRKPYGRNDRLITRLMWRNMLGQAAYQLVVQFVILFAGPAIFGVVDSSVRHFTILFNAFVFMQVFNEINSRKVNGEFNVFEGFFDNFLFSGVIIFTVVAQVFIVEFGGSFFSTTGLLWSDWLFCLGVGLFSLPWGIVVRLIPVEQEEYMKEAPQKPERFEQTPAVKTVEMDVITEQPHDKETEA